MLTAQMLKLGYKASAEQFGPRELVDYAVLAEELGYDSVVVSDHFQPWRHDGGHAPFSFSWLPTLGGGGSRPRGRGPRASPSARAWWRRATATTPASSRRRWPRSAASTRGGCSSEW